MSCVYENSFHPTTDPPEVIQLDKICSAWVDGDHRIKFQISGCNNNTVTYANKETRDKEFKELQRALAEKNKSPMKPIKEYCKKHEDVIIPALGIMVFDHLFNDGDGRKRIAQSLKKLLGKPS